MVERPSAKMFDMKLRLGTGLRLLMALLILLGVFGITQMMQLADLTERLYNHPFLVSTAALRISEQITHMHTLIERVELVRTLPELNAIILEMDDRHDRVVQDFKTIEERFLGDKQKVTEARQLFTGWMRVREKLATLQKMGDPDKIRRFADALQEDNQQVVHLDQTIDEVVALANQSAQRFIIETQWTRDRTIWLAILVVAFSVVLALLLSRATRSPLQAVVNMLSSAASQMAASINQQERVASQQAAAMTETTTTMEELDASSRQSAEQAVRAANGAQQALELANQGIVQVEETLQNMGVAQETVGDIAQRIRLLNEQTGEIRSITELVTDFANETRMLAVNAAVEAVRAGVHGKGFAVLAVETRKLADESKQSASRIHGLISEIQKATDSTVRATDAGNRAVEGGMISSHGTAESFRGVLQAIGGAAQGAQQISLNARQQATAIRQVTEAIQSVNMGTRETASGMSQIKMGVQVLNDAAQTLKRMV